MAQFYSDEIQKDMSKIKNELKKKRQELNIFIGKSIKDYAYEGKKMTLKEYNQKVNLIMNLDIDKKVLSIKNKAMRKNIDNDKKILKKANIKQKYNNFKPNVKNIKKFIKEYKKEEKLFKKRGYTIYLRAIRRLEVNVREKLNELKG